MNIVPMPPFKGICNVCDTSGTLLFYDRASGIKVGNCCQKELRWADQTISMIEHKTGICHPKYPTK